MSRPLSFQRCLSLCGLLVLAWFGPGCVTVYQPLSTLQRPVVVDTRVENFKGLHLLVRCVPGEHLNAGASQNLCRRVSALFRNQGAEVEIEVPRNGRAFARAEDAKRPDLIVDLSARLLSQERSSLLTLLSFASLTLIPAVTDYSVAQDVRIRDANGFLLASDTLQARFIEYFGFGIWSVNWVLDVVVRPDEEEFTGDAPKKEFSKDFYGALSQLVFNAHVRSVVLGGFDKPIDRAPPPPDAAEQGGN